MLVHELKCYLYCKVQIFPMVIFDQCALMRPSESRGLKMNIMILSLFFFSLGASNVFAAAQVNQEVTIDTIDEIFSYETISEVSIRHRAQKILKKGMLGFTFEDHVYCKHGRFVEPILTRIRDNWQFVTTKIERFKAAHRFNLAETDSLDLWPNWTIKTIEGHFENTLRDEAYRNRHELKTLNIETQEQAERILKGAKEYFQSPDNIQYLRDLQLEGLALNLIYHAVIYDEIKRLYYIDLEVPKGIKITHAKWSKDPIIANITDIPRL